jgi:hypothetical protein
MKYNNNMLTKEKFEEYCKSHNLRYIFNGKYYIENELKEKFDINCLFITICSYGYIETAKWLYNDYEKYIYINFDNYLAFTNSCKGGHFELAKWLYSLGIDIMDIDYVYNFFWSICNKNHIEIAKWLYSLDNNILDDGIEDNNNHNVRRDIFIDACVNGNIHMAKWFHSLGYNLSSFYSKIFEFCCFNYKHFLNEYEYECNNKPVPDNKNEILEWLLFDLKCMKLFISMSLDDDNWYYDRILQKVMEYRMKKKRDRQKHLFYGFLFGGQNSKLCLKMDIPNFNECLKFF